MLTATRQLLFSGTSTGIRALTLANVITDATRRAALEGDGLSVPGGYRIDPATTNKITQSIPGAAADTNLTFTPGGGGTLELVDNDGAPFQNSAGKVWRLADTDGTTTATVAFTGTVANVNAHSISIWARIETGATGVRIQLSGGEGQVSVTSESWTRVTSENITPGATTRTMQILFSGAGTGAVRFVAAQLEELAVATSHVRTDGASAARSAGQAQVSVERLFTATQGWCADCVVPRWNSALMPNVGPRVWSHGDGSTDLLEVLYVLNDRWRFTNGAVGGAANESLEVVAAVVSGTRYLVGSQWQSDNFGLSIDGAAASMFGSRAEIPTVTSTVMELCESQITAAREFGGNLLWKVVGRGVPTAADWTLLNTWKTAGTVPTMNQLDQLSAASKPTLLIPADTSAARLLPAYFGGTL